MICHISDEMNDILKALMTLRASFQRHGLKVPIAITLEDAEQGYRLRHYLHQSEMIVYVEDDTTFSSMKVMGIEIRWPAKKYALEDGEVRYL